MTGGDAAPERDVVVNAAGHDGVPEVLLRRAVVHVLDHEGVPDAELSVTMMDDETIRQLNREYLSEDRPTDVIAFSLGDDERVLGDVYLGFAQAARQADELSIPLHEELARLVIHGTLHVLGWDHPEDGERGDSPMYRLQERLLGEVLDGQ